MPFRALRKEEWPDKVFFAENNYRWPHPSINNLNKRSIEDKVDIFWGFYNNPLKLQGHFIVYPISKETMVKIRSGEIDHGSFEPEHLAQSWGDAAAIYVAYLIRYDWPEENKLNKIFGYTALDSFIKWFLEEYQKPDIIVLAKTTFQSKRSLLKRLNFQTISNRPIDEFLKSKENNCIVFKKVKKIDQFPY
ncbi:MAG: hypothetical protein RIC35_14960 [Marinoscillum sp.]